MEIILKISGQTKVVKYTSFSLGSESNKYQLTYGGFNPTTSGLSDGFRYASDMSFSTHDRDNDAYSGHCGQSRDYGWWFRNCYDGLNQDSSSGPYYVGYYDESIMILKPK